MMIDTTVIELKLAASKQLVKELLAKGDFLDKDGYPTEDALEIIRNWTFKMSQRELFEFIKSIWWSPDWGWTEGEYEDGFSRGEMVYQYHISTGGWSGNESIIRAMEENEYFMWHFAWVQSRRGGHYIFELRDFEPEETA